jgi:hypothetical protein
MLRDHYAEMNYENKTTHTTFEPSKFAFAFFAFSAVKYRFFLQKTSKQSKAFQRNSNQKLHSIARFQSRLRYQSLRYPTVAFSNLQKPKFALHHLRG